MQSSTEAFPEAKEKRLELLATLLAATLDGQPSTADVQVALNSSTADEDDDAWRVRVAECAHAREGGVSADTGPPASSGAAAATQEWVCPMCETVNWALDARKSLRRRPEESGSAPLPSAALRCACCGYGGAAGESGEEGEV